jgi:hypothetical protein
LDAIRGSGGTAGHVVFIRSETMRRLVPASYHERPKVCGNCSYFARISEVGGHVKDAPVCMFVAAYKPINFEAFGDEIARRRVDDMVGSCERHIYAHSKERETP